MMLIGRVEAATMQISYKEYQELKARAMTQEDWDGQVAGMLIAVLLTLGGQESQTMGREIWAETVLIRAFRNELDKREWVDTLGARRGQVLAERLARISVAALKERKLLASERGEDEQEQSGAAGDGGGAAADAGTR